MIRLEDGSFGWDFIVRNLETDATVYVQTDWDYPSIAEAFGWSLRSVQVPGKPECRHDGTDGTVKCGECGATVEAFLSGARDYLSDNTGKEAEDPGYFGEES